MWWRLSPISGLEDFAKTRSGERFDVAMAILVFEHIQDLNAALHDTNLILEIGGQFYLIICDKDYGLSNNKEIRSGQHVSAEIIQNLEDEAVKVKTARDLGDGIQSVMYDIFRPIEKVRVAAKANGFELIAEKTLMTPTAPALPMFYVLNFLKKVNV